MKSSSCGYAEPLSSGNAARQFEAGEPKIVKPPGGRRTLIYNPEIPQATTQLSGTRLSSTWCLATALAENILGLEASLFVCLATSHLSLAPRFALVLNLENITVLRVSFQC